MNEYSELSPN
jgi:hypothetical protein